MHGSARTSRTVAAKRLLGASGLAGSLLLATACSSGPGFHAGPSTDALGPLPSPSSTALPYGEALDDAVTPVGAALALLNKATNLKDLGTALDNAQQAASTASRDLQDSTAPADASDQNHKLWAALNVLSTDLGTVQTDITTDKACATSSALAEAGQLQSLKDVAGALQTLSAAGYASNYTAPTLPAPQQRALGNGTWVRQGGTSGTGVLKVDNSNGDGDAVVTLSKSGQSAYSLYVVKGQSTTVNGIEDGTYDVYTTSGLDWDANAKMFTENCDFQKFDSPVPYTTDYHGDGSYTYYEETITLHAKAGTDPGDTASSKVPPDQYPTP
ncbi:hypothetical protein [Kitasatospora sp. LaBMicrA B282]|uniref:hypothetical protein n=1 Tax=Kitasatospora sp. LaBMicrA B282 TaxID=3420949 RepID=UPI003D0FD579